MHEKKIATRTIIPTHFRRCFVADFCNEIIPYNLDFFVLSYNEVSNEGGGLTAGVTRLGWEGGVALETESRTSHEKPQKTRCVPQVGCTHC